MHERRFCELHEQNEMDEKRLEARFGTKHIDSMFRVLEERVRDGRKKPTIVGIDCAHLGGCKTKCFETTVESNAFHDEWIYGVQKETDEKEMQVICNE